MTDNTKTLYNALDKIKELEKEKCELLGLIQEKDKLIEIICKENAGLKKDVELKQRCWQDQKNIPLDTNCSLHKAKEIIKNLVDSLIAIDGEQIRELEAVKEAEQFIKLQKILNAENKKCREIIKRTVAENFCCNDCKEIGIYAECQKNGKSCETFVSEWLDEVMGW